MEYEFLPHTLTVKVKNGADGPHKPLQVIYWYESSEHTLLHRFT